MKKIYDIINNIEVSNYEENEDIIDSVVPSWIRKKMKRLAKIEKCSIRELRYERQIYFEDNEWIDVGQIIKEIN